MSIINLYQFETDNVGDLNCSPCQYFDYDAEKFDIKRSMHERVPAADAYIVGGGGAPRTMKYPLPGVKIAWGIGTTHRSGQFADFDLVGSRDKDHPEFAEWVPCASCMSPLFDEEYEVKHGKVFYSPSAPDRPDCMTNQGRPMEQVIEFLGSGEVVVTDSYHGAYWATLLGKITVIVNPHSAKFYQYKHQPVVIEDGTNPPITPYVFPAALQECRNANIRFNAKVQDCIRNGSTQR